MEHGIIIRKASHPLAYFGWGSVVRLNQNTLMAACSGDRLEHICPFGKTELFFSRDEGKTWSCPMILNDTPLDDRDVGLTRLGENQVLLTWFNHPLRYMTQWYQPEACNRISFDYMDLAAPYDAKKQGSHIRITRDGGWTWTPEAKVEVGSPHGPCVLSDGSLLYLGKSMYTDLAPRSDTEYAILDGTIAAWRSTDGGESWEKLADLPMPEHIACRNFHEPHAVQLPSGRILGMIRGEPLDGNHFPYPYALFQTYSDDGGKTWSMPDWHGTPAIVRGSPAHLLVHSSGAVICSYGRRHAPFGERAMISFDGGESWAKDVEIRSALDGDLGYPCSMELADGRILTVYYQKYEENGKYDEKTSFLYTIWSLDEV